MTLTPSQNRLAKTLLAVLQTFGVKPNEKLAALFEEIGKHRDCSSEHCNHPITPGSIDMDLADRVIEIFDFAKVPQNDDTYTAIAWLADQIRHKTLGLDLPDSPPVMSPGNSTVN